MDVSIIIVNYKTPDLIIDCVRSIKELTENISYEIIVVDNASNDDSIGIMNQELKEDIKLIESDTNLGFGKANNLGVKHAKGEYVFLLNSDTVLINNAIKILYNFLKQDPTVGVVGGNLYSRDLKENSSFCMKFDDIEDVKRKSSWITIIKDILERRYRERFYSEEQKRHYSYRNTFNFTNEPMEVSYIFGADMMLSRKLYNQMGGFDPDFFMYAEEEELSWRIHKLGYKIVNVPSAKIIHLDGASLKKDTEFSPKQYGMRMTGAMTYYKKRFGIKGMEEFYFYKTLRLKRQIKLAKLLRRQLLLEVSENQLECWGDISEKLKKAYKQK